MNKPQIHWFYKRVKVQKARENIYFELASGLAFLLRRFHLMQPETVLIDAVWRLFPGVGIELLDGTGAIRWQLQPIPAQLYSAPRKDGIIIKQESNPHDQTGYGVNMSANFKPRTNTVNLYYDVGEQIFIDMTGQEYYDTSIDLRLNQWMPNYVDLAVEGVYLP
jgi:hypothetical protein